jgi:hypothetical protein
MVVEILEDKLDQDYVDYISNMIMKDALEEIDQDSASTDLDQADGNNEMRYMKKYEDCPSNWDPMDERDVKRDVSMRGEPVYYLHFVSISVTVVKHYYL